MSSRTYPSSGQPNGHSRRDVASSTTSSSGRSERGSRQPKVHDSIESAVTRLLVSIKQLLESLTQWSQQKLTEEGVSDVYVQLGNDFNVAVQAFGQFNIDMSELHSVPDELRIILEQCLAEDATEESLAIYLPDVRQIITNLLQGLRQKQVQYRKIHRDSGHERTDVRSSRTGSSRRDGTHRLTGSRPQTQDGSDQSAAARRSRKRETPPTAQSGSAAPGNNDFVGGFAPALVEQQTGQSEDSERQVPQSDDYFDPQRLHERSGPGPSSLAYNDARPTEPREYQPSFSRSATPVAEEAILPPPPPSSPPVPANVKRYSLVDKPVEKPTQLAPAVVVESSSPLNSESGVELPQMDNVPNLEPPAVAKSLAALKSNEVLLERRASKRFSIYNISKMTGASISRERSLRNNANQLNRRSVAAATSNLTPGELAVLTEDDEEAIQFDDAETVKRYISQSPDNQHVVPPVPPLPTTPSRLPEPPSLQAGTFVSQTSSHPSKITIFLQLGREVKKVTVDPRISFAALRVLFVDKFSYNPGLENFPAIYIRDPSSQVQYELEDADEVKDKCLLSLNVEPLDQIKQHIDTQMAGLANDLKELKAAIATRNQKPMMQLEFEPALAESTPAARRPSERQFQTVARRLSRLMGDSNTPSFTTNVQPPVPPIPSIQAQMTGQSLQPQMTGASVVSEYTNRVVNDLKTQFDEVQNLRRDLGVMRQLYTEFMKSTKESLSTLRGQTQSVKQLANSNVGGTRQYIDVGKKKLDTRSQSVLTEVEKLQDIIESVKDDVIKRQITPNGMYFKSIKKDMDSVATELASLSEHITAIKPMWKKTWEEELQNIVEEQQFLTHQEEFLSDLLEDHKAMVEVYGHVEKVISLRKPAGKRLKGYKPRPQEDSQSGLNIVMSEIRGAQINSDKRMQAIEANKKNRLKEISTRSNDLHEELYDFVGQKKLKLTGGAEEAERVRQKKSEAALKAIFNGPPSFGPIQTPTST